MIIRLLVNVTDKEPFILDPATLMLVKMGPIVLEKAMGGTHGKKNASVESASKPKTILRKSSFTQGEKSPSLGEKRAETSRQGRDTLPMFELESRYGGYEKVCRYCGRPTKSHQDEQGRFSCHKCYLEHQSGKAISS